MPKYAIIETGGKQYRVEEGEAIIHELVLPQKKEGDELVFDKVLLVAGEEGLKLGKPYLDGPQVLGTIEEQGRGEKIIVFKYKPKKRYRKKAGHRQPYLKTRIKEIRG